MLNHLASLLNRGRTRPHQIKTRVGIEIAYSVVWTGYRAAHPLTPTGVQPASRGKCIYVLRHTFVLAFLTN